MWIWTMFLGLIAGSFLNVVIYRLPRGESMVWPGSHCTSCGHRLGVLDLVPVVSFLLLRGRCRYCGRKISWRYPLVELLTMAAFLLVYRQWGFGVWTGAGCFLTAVLIAVACIDAEKGIIPDILTYPGMIAGLAVSCLTIGAANAFIGMLSFGGLFYFIAWVTRGGLGGGDVKLAAMIGAFVGLQGASEVFVLSSIAGGLWAAGLLLLHRADRKTEVHFGPFLSLSAFLVFLYGEDLLTYYLEFF